MDITIIIVSYNTKDLTLNCLRSVYAKTEKVRFEVVVVDNASTDGSPEAIRKEFPHSRLIENPVNLGFGAANNRAIRETRSNYVFLLNSDTLLVNNAAKILFDAMECAENKNIGICGGSFFTEYMTPHLSYGNFPSLGQIIFELLELHHLFGKWYENSFQTIVENRSEAVRTVDYVSGAGMFLRRAALDRAGLFDEDFFLYFEDTELSYRLKNNGYSSLLVPQAKILHLSCRDAVYDEKKFRIIERSRYLFFYKCYGPAITRISKYVYLLRYLLRTVITGNGRYWNMGRLIADTWR